MRIPREMFANLPYPFNAAGRELESFTAAWRIGLAPLTAGHWAKGCGTLHAICPPQRMARWDRAELPERLATAGLHLAGTFAQAGVWLAAGCLAGAAACVLRVAHGRETARYHMAHWYLPMAYTLVVAGAFCYLAGALGAALLLGGRLA